MNKTITLILAVTLCFAADPANTGSVATPQSAAAQPPAIPQAAVTQPAVRWTDAESKLFRAARFGELEGVKRLVAEGTNTRLRGKYQVTLLHEAAKTYNLPLVKYLVEELPEGQRLDPTAVDTLGYSVLHHVLEPSWSNDTIRETQIIIDIIKYLVDHGANPNLTNHKGKTILHLALDRPCDLEVIEFLVETLRMDPNVPGVCPHSGLPTSFFSSRIYQFNVSVLYLAGRPGVVIPQDIMPRVEELRVTLQQRCRRAIDYNI